MAWRRRGDRPLLEPMLDLVHWRIYAALGEYELMLAFAIKPVEQITMKTKSKMRNISFNNLFLKILPANCIHSFHLFIQVLL